MKEMKFALQYDCYGNEAVDEISEQLNKIGLDIIFDGDGQEFDWEQGGEVKYEIIKLDEES